MKRFLAMVLVAVLCLSFLPAMVSAAGDYYVAGSSGLCGSEWDPGDAFNKMTPKDDGTYAITFYGVEPGTYAFKVTMGNWDTSWGKDGNDYPIQVNSTCDVTITFDPNTTGITVSGSGVGEVTKLDVESVRVAGTDNLCGTAWDTGADANKMTASGSVYTITYKNLAAGSYEFKFAANGSWANNWGAVADASFQNGVAVDAVFNSSDNVKLSLTEASDVTLKLDLSGFDYSSKTGAKYTVTVQAAAGEPVTDPSQGNTEPAPDASEPAGDTKETITVYAYVPNGWSAPGIWAWDDSQKNAFDAWPGLAMTEGEDGWWYAEVPGWVQNVIINANSGAVQTADLDMEKAEDMWILVTVENGTVNGVIHYTKPDVQQQPEETNPPASQPATDNNVGNGASKPSTEPSEPAEDEAKDDGSAGQILLYVVVLLVSAGIGVGAVLLIHKLKDKKNA